MRVQVHDKPLLTIKMPNGILSSNNIASSNNVKQHLFNHHQHTDKQYTNGTIRKYPDKNDKQEQQQQSGSILNVAEMLLHGVADHEILEIWLRSITCQEFVKNFLEAGYDMPTISRVTPQDLTAIGITEPTKRSKIISEIKKLNLQDGIPSFRPASLSHWLALLRLDSNYYKSLCDQKIDTIDKVCQLTWEDFEELGITKLGHQKRLQIAIERVKDLESAELKGSSKPISEPIYDTNSSQILLVASSENHSMNGPIINKQSSTSELSSTGSGSMHSIYSASSHHQPTSHAVHQNTNNADTNGRQQQQAQTTYNQAAPPLFHQQQQHILQSHPPLLQPPTLPPPNLRQQLHGNLTPTHQQVRSKTSHYQATPQQFTSLSFSDDSNKRTMFNNNVTLQQQQQHHQSNRQSLGQLPFMALANLPKHQQQLLQQSSIYATLSRQPQRIKQPPPPVPIRTNSLKSNSLIDEEDTRQRNEQFLRNTIDNTTRHQQQLIGDGSHSSVSANSLFRTGSRATNRSHFNTQLQKNKSFSGNAYMDAARARFLNRNSGQQQQIYSTTSTLTPNIRNFTNGPANSGLNILGATTDNHPQQFDIYGSPTISTPCNGNLSNGHPISPQLITSNDNSLSNATTGRDDDFPPPPSPLSMTDYDAQTISEFA